MRSKVAIVVACGAVLVLGACSTGGSNGVLQAEAAAEKAALADLHASLAAANKALGAVQRANTGQQRNEARRAVIAARDNLADVQEALAAQPESDARTAASEALAAVDTALERTAEALQATGGATASRAGPVQLADMHTSLDRAQEAVKDAQAALGRALAAEGITAAIRTALSQAQTTLSTAQISLVPLLRAELDERTARADAAEAALADLHASLAEANEALGALQRANTGQQRNEARRAVIAARDDLADVREDLAMQPASAARTAADAALAAVDTALERTAEALQATGGATASRAGPVQLADMHTSLDRAQEAVEDAQAALSRALAAEGITAAIRTALSQAQTTLSTAQTSLVPLLRAELDEQTARADAEKARADTEKARADTYDPRVSLTAALLPREERFVPRGQAQSITRTPRTDTGEAGWAKLAIRTLPFAFATGKRVGAAAGGLVATDELPLRAVTLRAGGRHPIRIQGDDGTPCTATPGTCRNTDGVLESALRIGADGVTLKFGGEGVVYYDMQRTYDYYDGADETATNHDAWWRYGSDGKLGDASASSGDTITASHARDLGLDEAGGTLTGTQATALQGYATDNAGACWRDPLSDCGDWAHDDFTITFGAPSQSPQGEPAYYWKVQHPFTQAQRDTGLPKWVDPDHDDYNGGTQEVGTYELWLSHYGGVDDKGTEAESDDTHRYLEYAAYGLFQVFDNLKATPSFIRPQAFAFGYDAFRDADGMKTTDLTTSVAATFKGHTMARALRNDGNETFITLNGATPLRGGITLNACIGGSGCTGHPTTAANKISGMISGLEELRHDGVWIPYSGGSNAGSAAKIRMMEGDIAADGSFGGLLDHPQHATDNSFNSWSFDAGSGTTSQYAGNLYGPTVALEAAGWWHMQRDNRDRALHSSIIGSFGAACTSGCGQ